MQNIALAIDVINTHDIQLARNLYKFLQIKNVLLGDRAFCAYADLVSMTSLGCDAVFRKHQSRKTSMRKGKIVGDCDKFGFGINLKNACTWLSKEEFAALPRTLVMREIYYYVIIPGFRTQQVSLITTLLDSKTYPTLELVKLYDEHWGVEVN